jgi:hypothetical protein
MSLFKLAVYGGIGYLVYQMFFSDAASGMRQGRGDYSRQGGLGDEGDRGQQRFSGGGGERGQAERTEEPSGMSSSHRVGRGVVT